VAVVCLNEINAPGCQCARVVIKVAVAARPSEFAGERTDAGIDPDFQAFGVHVVGDVLHAQGEAVGVSLAGVSSIDMAVVAAPPAAGRCCRVTSRSSSHPCSRTCQSVTQIECGYGVDVLIAERVQALLHYRVGNTFDLVRVAAVDES
jgi:hypothetical protein